MTVSIVGVGLHPFGRFDISGREMGLIAACEALADAGVTWNEVGFAAGGSRDSGHAAALVSELGLTGVPFIGVYNGCGTAGSAVLACRQAIESGAADVVLGSGVRQAQPRRVRLQPCRLRPARLVCRAGDDGDHPVLRAKIRRYLHDHGLDPKLLAEVAAKALRNGAITPHAWRRKPVPAEEIASASMVNDPLTSYMFCSPSEGGAAVVLMATERAHRLGIDAVEVKALEFRTRRFGTFEVFSPSLAPEITDGATVYAGLQRSKRRGSALARSTSPNCRTPRPAPS